MTASTVVVGAGPAGLAVAGALRQRGLDSTVLERADSVGASWRARYDSLRLHTMRRLSGLPGAVMPRRYGQWVARDDLVAYFEDYVRRFDLDVDLGVEVTRIDRTAGAWRLETSAGGRAARTVVVATGYTHTPYVPDWPGLVGFPGSFSHAVAYREPTDHRGRKVLVVGAGNSASEIAVELAEAGAEVLLSVRTPPNIVRRDTLGVPSQVIGVALAALPEVAMNPLLGALRRLTVPDLRGYGLPPPPGDGFSQFLRSRAVPILDHGFVTAVRRGQITVVPTIASIDGADVRLTDDTVVRPDAIVAATGYRPGLEPVVGHLGVLRDGVPRVSGADSLPDAPGLHFVGIGVNLSGLIRQMGQEARAVSRVIAADAA